MVKYKCRKGEEVHIKMSEKRYGKPNMNNLPYELGKEIFEEILNSPKVDREARRREGNQQDI